MNLPHDMTSICPCMGVLTHNVPESKYALCVPSHHQRLAGHWMEGKGSGPFKSYLLKMCELEIMQGVNPAGGCMDIHMKIL